MHIDKVLDRKWTPLLYSIKLSVHPFDIYNTNCYFDAKAHCIKATGVPVTRKIRKVVHVSQPKSVCACIKKAKKG